MRLTFVFLALLVASVWSADHRAEDKRARAEIQKRLDVIRAAGQPVTAQDLAGGTSREKLVTIPAWPSV